MTAARFKIGIVAGERSGDILGSGLMAAIAKRIPDVSFHGVGGETMLANGLHSLAHIDELSVNGFIDPLRRIVPLYRLLATLRRQLLAMDVFIGVDFNVFNLMLERWLKKHDIPTAHYVSPSIYAWRRGRVRKIGRSTDVVMTLFPFETAVYESAAVRAAFIGHPTADQYDPDKTRNELREDARSKLGIERNSRVIALLPGSRRSELKFHFELFLNSVRTFIERSGWSDCLVLVPSAHPSCQTLWEVLQPQFHGLDVEITAKPATEALAACDIALVKSGTATLEAMFMKTPMVIAYRLGALTGLIVQSMLRTSHVGLPNILANKRLVPELIQREATVENIATAMLAQLDREEAELQKTYTILHRTLRQDASARAAEVVLSLLPAYEGTYSRS